MIIYLLLICVAIFTISAFLLSSETPGSFGYSKHFKSYSEYSRITNIVFKFYNEDINRGAYSNEFKKFEKILDLNNQKYGNESELSDTIKKMEEKSKQIFELYKNIIPEFKKEKRDRNLEDLLK